MLSVATLRGLWQRSLIAWPDGQRDTTTAVRWLQGPGFYIDLRQPADRPDFGDVACLDDVGPDLLPWLAEQEGFAGLFRHDGAWFEWQRDLDLQPRGLYSDCGSLRFDGDVLVEEGRDLPYVEHWHRGPAPVAPCAAAKLLGADDGRIGFIVRTGDLFMFARGRARPLPDLPHLRDAIAAAPGLRAARDLIDCEISFGRVTAAGWVIDHSSLPWREGRSLAPMAGLGSASLLTTETARDATPAARAWTVATLQGVLTDLIDFTAHAPLAADR